MQTHLDEDFDQLMELLDSDNDGKVTEDDLRSLLFCDFADAQNPGKYCEAHDIEQLHKVAHSFLEEYNQISKKQMNLVLFRLVTS